MIGSTPTFTEFDPTIIPFHVYCDIPYKGTADYLNAFDHKAFYEWAMTRDFPVYVSEYSLDDPRFKLVYSVDKRSLKAADKTVGNKSEKLFWNGKDFNGKPVGHS